MNKHGLLWSLSGILFAAALLACLSGCVSGRGKAPDPAPHEPGPEDPGREIAAGFHEGLQFTTQSPGLELLPYDMNGNGKPDLLVRLLGGGVSMIWNNSLPGSMQFTPQSLPATGNLRDAKMADLNGDSRQDLFLLADSTKLLLYLQNAQRQFELFGEYQTGGSLILPQLVDTVDSVHDVLVAFEDLGDARALFFNPTDLGPFYDNGNTVHLPGHRAIENYTTFSEIRAVDFEGNDVVDFAIADAGNRQVHLFTHIERSLGELVANPETGEIEEAQPGVYYNYQSALYSHTSLDLPNISTHIEDPIIGSPDRMDFADFNDDGIMDAAVLCQYNGEIPAEPWFASTPAPTGEVPHNMIWLFEGEILPWYDGGPDWVGDDSVPRTATLNARASLAFPNIITDIKLADLDKDGNVDVVCCCDGPRAAGNRFFFYPGLGGFSFGPPVAFTVPSPPLRLVCADFDSDGFTDVAVLMPAVNQISVFRNDGGTLGGLAGQQYSF